MFPLLLLAGWVVVTIAVTLHFYRIVVEWYQPKESIDVVPTLLPSVGLEQNGDTTLSTNGKEKKAVSSDNNESSYPILSYVEGPRNSTERIL